MQALALRLEELRTARGIRSVRAFAIKCGISVTPVQNYFKATSSPGAANLRKIATTFRVSLDWLASGNGTMEESAPAGPHRYQEHIDRIGYSGEKDEWFPTTPSINIQRLGRAIEMAENGSPSLHELRQAGPLPKSTNYLHASNVVVFYNQLTKEAQTQPAPETTESAS